MADEHDHKQRGHDKFQSGRVKLDDTAQQCAQGRPAHPVQMVEQGDKEHEPAPVDALRRLDRAVDGERLVAHAENQIKFLPSGIFELFQHGNAVKQVSRVDHERQNKGVEGLKR